MRIRSRVRIVLGIVAVAGLGVAALASRSGARPNLRSSAITCPAVEGPKAAMACGFPVWCCPGGPGTGVTATGQATLKGSSPQIRDEAIRQAVADARRQAEVAANAAGFKLGQVLSMQISASGYPYPLEAGAGGGTAVPPSAPCPSGVECPPTITVPVQTFVSVTIAWAIG